LGGFVVFGDSWVSWHGRSGHRFLRAACVSPAAGLIAAMLGSSAAAAAAAPRYRVAASIDQWNGKTWSAS
jgi:hypothetical protein